MPVSIARWMSDAHKMETFLVVTSSFSGLLRIIVAIRLRSGQKTFMGSCPNHTNKKGNLTGK